jgi:alpha-amylase
MKKTINFLKLSGIIIIVGVAGYLVSCSVKSKNMKRESSVIHTDWSRDAVIYEVNLRQYTPEGTFKAFEQHLPRLKELGVDILWLMPVNPIGITNRKGTLGSYYSIKDYRGINPEFGTMEDFKNLVNKAHSLGMKVIIDWVANHTSWDNNLITEHPEWYTHDSTGKIIAPVADWTDAADLDYSKAELREYMKESMIFWIKEADIDGFRCDVAGMVPVDFWNKAVPEIKKVKSIFMLAEWETPEMHDTAFDMSYGWDLYHLMNAISKGEKTADDIDLIWSNEDSIYTPDAYRMRFTSNHDENSWNGAEYERMGAAAQTFAVMSFTVPGMPLIYSGQEAAFNKRLRFFDKDTIDWDDYKLSVFYSILIRLKKENKALWNGNEGGTIKRIHTNSNKEIYAFIREKDGNKVLVILNLTSKPQNVDLHDHADIGTFINAFTGKIVRFEDTSIFSLKPWEYLIFSNKIN